MRYDKIVFMQNAGLFSARIPESVQALPSSEESL